MQPQMENMLKTRQFRLLLIVTAGLFVLILFAGRKQPEPPSIRKRRPLDLSSLDLDQETEKVLLEEHGLRPHKSRGATIFLDTSGQIKVPPDNILDLMEFRDLEETYHRYLETIQEPCKLQIHLGKHEDGGYDLCEDPEVIPTRPCIVYSFGVRDDFSFDEKLSETYGCQIHSFDPANGMKDHQYSSKIFFHSLGIGETNTVNKNKWNIRTANTIMMELGHHKENITVMKIDIEGSEWNVLPEMLQTSAFSQVRQLIIEFHSWVDLPPWQLDHRNKGDYRQHLKVLRSLFNEGFRIFFFKRFPGACCLYTDEINTHRTGCHEIHMMKVI